MKTETLENNQQLTKDDFISDQMVKWCPGCGDHAILAAVSKVFPKLGKRKEDFCVISGIGCSSRFPYYVNTYGIHGIHGRALPIASGVKVANPNLSVWVTTGDGDAMAIGGNHFIHTIRRNLDLNIILFNNQIFGLTKGQYSPTTPIGGVTKTSPYGSIERPFNPGELVMGAEGTFFARGNDSNPRMMTELMLESARHQGTSMVEILQNCVIYNNGAHRLITAKETKEDYQLHLKHGEPMIFGKEKNKGIQLNGIDIEVVTIGKNGVSEDDLLVHDAHNTNPSLHLMLARMMPPKFPMALGVIRAVKERAYESLLEDQIASAKEQSDMKTVDDLLFSGNTWEI